VGQPRDFGWRRLGSGWCGQDSAHGRWRAEASCGGGISRSVKTVRTSEAIIGCMGEKLGLRYETVCSWVYHHVCSLVNR
jgi:hypothetical protein